MKTTSTAKAAPAQKRAEAERIERDRIDVPPGVCEVEEEERRAMSGKTRLLAAILQVQAEMPALKKTATANAGKFEYKYIPLDEIWATLRPILTKHGLVVTNTMENNMLKTVLAHAETGEEVSCAFPINANQPPQQLGSAFTYARRYALCALLQIVADNDDDGAAAMPKTSSNPF